MKLIRLIILLLCLPWYAWAQHNSSYSQYMFNGLILNPAYAGSQDALNVTGLYRKQWIGIDGAPTNITFSAHTPLKNKKINVGLIIIQDKFGINDHLKADLIYAYRFKLLDGHLSLGLQAGIDSYRINWERLQTTQANDPSFGMTTQKKVTPEAGFGAYYYSKKIFLGFSSPILFNNAVNLYKTIIFNAGGVVKLTDQINMKPVLLVKYLQHSPIDMTLSSTFYYKDLIGVGIGYSLKSSAMIYADVKINDQFRVGYAYDYTLNNLKNYAHGSHEIMLRYLFNYKVSSLSTRFF